MMTVKDISTPKEQWTWKGMAKVEDLMLTDAGTTYVNLFVCEG